MMLDVKGRLIARFRCKCGDYWEADATCPTCGMTVSALTAAAPVLADVLRRGIVSLQESWSYTVNEYGGLHQDEEAWINEARAALRAAGLEEA